MAAKPTSLPRFASEPTAAVVPPEDLQKDTGWVPGQKPPAQTFNWLHQLTYKWLAWISDLETDPRVWVGPATFVGDVWLPDDSLVHHGLREIQVPAIRTAGSATSTNVAVSNWLEVSTNGDVYIPAGLPVGSVIEDLFFCADGDGAVDVTATIYRVDSTGTPSIIESLAFPNIPASPVTRAMPVSPSPSPVSRNESIIIHFAVSGLSTAVRIGNISLQFTK